MRFFPNCTHIHTTGDLLKFYTYTNVYIRLFFKSEPRHRNFIKHMYITVHSTGDIFCFHHLSRWSAGRNPRGLECSTSLFIRRWASSHFSRRSELGATSRAHNFTILTYFEN